jgi:predicted ATPase
MWLGWRRNAYRILVGKFIGNVYLEDEEDGRITFRWKQRGRSKGWEVYGISSGLFRY